MGDEERMESRRREAEGESPLEEGVKGEEGRKRWRSGREVIKKESRWKNGSVGGREGRRKGRELTAQGRDGA